MSINRRELLAAGGAFVLAGLGGEQAKARDAASRPARTPKRLRTITYNVLAFKGYPTNEQTELRLRVGRSQIIDRIALELALYDPDLISFQESPPEKVVAAVADRLGMNYCFFPSPVNWPGAIITRYKISESVNCPLSQGSRPKDLFTRHWGRAILETDDGLLPVYSAHLFPAINPATRLREIPKMLEVMAPDIAANRSMILQGDLNLLPGSPEYKLLVDSGLIDTFVAKGVGQRPSIPSTKPRSCLDYVWVHGPLADRLKSCRTLFEGAFRTNPDDPTSFALSDHLPVMATFG